MTGQAVWRRACPAGQALDLLHARVAEPYAPHVHEEYAVGACTAGREVIRYRGTLHYAGPGSVVVLEPGEAHTGAPADPPDFTYRVMYPAAGLLAEGLLAEGAGRAAGGAPVAAVPRAGHRRSRAGGGAAPAARGAGRRAGRDCSRWRPNRGCPGCSGSWSGGTPRRPATSRYPERAGWPGW